MNHTLLVSLLGLLELEVELNHTGGSAKLYDKKSAC